MEVIDDRQTGETILDEALKMIKGQQDVEKLGINSWIDLMSGASFLLQLCFVRRGWSGHAWVVNLDGRG